MLNLRELEHAVQALDATRRDARLDKIVQPDAHSLVLTFAGGVDRPAGDRLLLHLSCAPRFGRVGALAKPRRAPESILPFAQYLRAHLEGARLRSAEILGGDRQALLRLETREGRFGLLLSLLGPRSNLYLLDAKDGLLLSIRSLDDTRRDLHKGARFTSPDSPPPAPGEDRFADSPDDALLEAIEQAYALEEEAADEDAERRRVRQALKKARDGVARKERRLRADLEQTAERELLRRHGELLKGMLARVPARASEVVATDYESGEEITIPLDPGLSASDNLERLFKRHRKLEKQALRAESELGAVAERLESLDALTAELEACPDPEAVEALSQRPEVARMIERFGPKAPARGAEPVKPKKVWKIGKRELPTRLVPKRYRSRDGLEIWVGKNDEGNDVLSTRLARAKDLFFHLEGSPGSHVVLRVEGGEPPQETVLEAAELAVHFSKQKNAGRASVHIAAIRDVSKPKGAKPGLVYVHRGRTIQLRRDPERLRRVMEARIAED